MATTEQEDLLDVLWHQVGCAYLSDLTNAWCAPKLVNCLQDIPPNQYPLRAWLDLLHYVTGGAEQFQTEEETRTALLLCLR